MYVHLQSHPNSSSKKIRYPSGSRHHAQPLQLPTAYPFRRKKDFRTAAPPSKTSGIVEFPPRPNPDMMMPPNPADVLIPLEEAGTDTGTVVNQPTTNPPLAIDITVPLLVNAAPPTLSVAPLPPFIWYDLVQIDGREGLACGCYRPLLFLAHLAKRKDSWLVLMGFGSPCHL